MKYKVKKYMRDRATGELRRPGQVIEVPAEAAEQLKKAGKIESAMVQPAENAMLPKPRHVGGGWYEINGKKVRKKDLESG